MNWLRNSFGAFPTGRYAEGSGESCDSGGGDGAGDCFVCLKGAFGPLPTPGRDHYCIGGSENPSPGAPCQPEHYPDDILP
jgi:hypothetical protein